MIFASRVSISGSPFSKRGVARPGELSVVLRPGSHSYSPGSYASPEMLIGQKYQGQRAHALQSPTPFVD